MGSHRNNNNNYREYRSLYKYVPNIVVYSRLDETKKLDKQHCILGASWTNTKNYDLKKAIFEDEIFYYWKDIPNISINGVLIALRPINKFSYTNVLQTNIVYLVDKDHKIVLYEFRFPTNNNNNNNNNNETGKLELIEYQKCG